LRAKVAVEAVVAAVSTDLAGRYTRASKELGRHVGGFLSGNDLYLFPDGTFIYCEWADIEPVTVYDKGTWGVADTVLELTSDPEITWPVLRDKRFAVVRRAGHAKEAILVGVEQRLPYFEEHAGDDPDLMLLIVGLVREKRLGSGEAARLRKKLMAEAWHPEYFGKQGAAEQRHEADEVHALAR
jgi:hypothetical protein